MPRGCASDARPPDARPATPAADYDAELPQKDRLCGCFWGRLALRALGVRSVAGEPVDQDLVAREAGTVLMGGD